MKKIREIKIPSLGIACLPLIFMVIVLIVGLSVFKVDIKILLLVSAIFTTLQAIVLGHTWKEVEKEFVGKLAKAFPTILILVCVGLMIGAWVIGGTVPFLVYIGLQVVSPKFIIITSFLVTVILSVSTGTSWGSVGTVGAALMSVAAGMGAPLPAVAGAIVAGAYFGDKMSPLSDSTNMSAVATQTNLYKHISHMFYTTVPGFILSCIVYIIAGISFASEGSVAQVDLIVSALNELFVFDMPVSLLLLLPPAIVLVGSIKKMPTVPVMITSAAVAVVTAVFVQGFTLQSTANSLVSGFKMDMFINSAVDLTLIPAEVPNLLQRGGMISMMTTVLTAFCAFSFIGALTVSGSLDVILPRILNRVKTVGGLVATTAATGVSIITIIGEASVSFFLVGGMFRNEYIKRGLESKNLSRTLEDTITVIEPLVPWSLAGIFMATSLGVSTFEYLPWAVLCYTGVIFAVIWGYTGFGMAKITEKSDEYAEYLELKKTGEAK